MPGSMASYREPLLSDEEARPARPSFLGEDALSARQQRVDERIRTLCLVVLSIAVLGVGLYALRGILIRFVLAVALSYLLSPLIDMLSCARASGNRRCRLPRGIATLVALAIAGLAMATLGFIVVRSITSFAAHADAYADRVEQLTQAAYNLTSRLDVLRGVDSDSSGALPHSNTSATESLQRDLTALARSQLSVRSLIMSLLGTAAHVVENSIYVLLFLAFLLADGKAVRRPSGARDGASTVAPPSAADLAIYRYIRGKVGVALFVAFCHAALLAAIQLNLWLVRCFSNHLHCSPERVHAPFARFTICVCCVCFAGVRGPLLLAQLCAERRHGHRRVLAHAPRAARPLLYALHRGPRLLRPSRGGAVCQGRARAPGDRPLYLAHARGGAPLGCADAERSLHDCKCAHGRARGAACACRTPLSSWSSGGARGVGGSMRVVPARVNAWSRSRPSRASRARYTVMVWGSAWGVTGMVLAVPMTAVARIYLAGLDHPLAAKVAMVLSGRDADDNGNGSERSDSDDKA